MGLDITAYSNIREIRPAMQDEDTDHGETKFWINKDFLGREDGIKEKTIYAYEDSHGFRAGSYSGYGIWRNKLAELAGYPLAEENFFGFKRMTHSGGAWAATEGPFWELINFADNEGTIGPVVSAKLAKDFAEFQAKADAHPEEWFRERYADWRKAFDLAAQNGAVSFH